MALVVLGCGTDRGDAGDATAPPVDAARLDIASDERPPREATTPGGIAPDLFASAPDGTCPADRDNP